MLYLALTMKDMGDPWVLVVTSRSLKTSLMTVMTFSSLFVVCTLQQFFCLYDTPLTWQRIFHFLYVVLFPAQEEFRDKGRFLYGESMGGAVALLLHKKDPPFWNGAVLVAPMCKVPILINECY